MVNVKIERKLILLILMGILLVVSIGITGCQTQDVAENEPEVETEAPPAEVTTPNIETATKQDLIFDTPSEWDQVVKAAQDEGHVTVVGFGSTTEHDFYRRLGNIFTERYGITVTYRDVGWFAAVEKITDEINRSVVGDIDAVMIWSVPFSEGYEAGIWWDVPIIDFIPNGDVVP